MVSEAHAESLANAIGVIDYFIEHRPNENSRPELLASRNVCTDRLQELPGDPPIPEFDRNDPRVGPATIRNAVVALDRVEEDVDRPEVGNLDRVQTIFHEHQSRLQEAEEA